MTKNSPRVYFTPVALTVVQNLLNGALVEHSRQFPSKCPLMSTTNPPNTPLHMDIGYRHLLGYS